MVSLIAYVFWLLKYFVIYLKVCNCASGFGISKFKSIPVSFVNCMQNCLHEPLDVYEVQPEQRIQLQRQQRQYQQQQLLQFE